MAQDLVGIALIGGLLLVVFFLFSRGGLSASQTAGQETGQTFAPQAGGSTTASGAGSFAVTQIFAPAYSYQTSTSISQQYTTQISPRIGLFNF